MKVFSHHMYASRTDSSRFPKALKHESVGMPRLRMQARLVKVLPSSFCVSYINFAVRGARVLNSWDADLIKKLKRICMHRNEE